MVDSKVISTLNGLIETCKDGEEGFRTAAGAVRDPHTKELFLEYSRQRAQMARELQEEVLKLGGDPEKSSSLSGTMHRGWINLKQAISGKDDRAVIAEAERGEDVAKEMYEKASSQDLPPSTRALVQQQAARVREAHDRVRTLEKQGVR